MIEVSVLLVLVAIVVLPYMLAGWNELPVDDAFRAQAPGKFIRLSDGQIHYQWLGDETGEVIVLLHGVSIPGYVFAQTAGGLVASGYRVLLFDHFGHGFSDRPSARYDAAFFRRQMLELFDALGLDEPIHVVGFSMGGVIAIDLGVHYPEQFRSLTLIAPAGIRIASKGDVAFVRVLKTPVVGQWLWRVIARSYFFPKDGADPAHEDPSSGEILHGEPIRQADYEGFLDAMRQIYSNMPLSHCDEMLSRINDTNIPVTALFGDADETIDIESARVLGDLIPRARVVAVAGGTHHLVIHRWNEINEIVLSSLAKNR